MVPILASGKYSFALWFLCIVVICHMSYELEHNIVLIRSAWTEIPNIDERAAQSRAAGNTQQQRKPQVTETITRDQPKIGRNDKVTIKNVMSGEKKTLKYKQAIPLIEKGDWVVVNQ